MPSLWLIPGVVVAAAALTGGLYWYARRYSVLDLPNERSAHTVPTPRGGGIAIVVAFLAAVAWLASGGVVDRAIATAILGAGAAVAVIGFIDDHQPIAAHWRLLAHLVAASWALYWLGGAPPIALFGWTIHLGWATNVVWAIGMVWLLNLYNFMDGIDGIAGVEALTTCAAAAVLYVALGASARDWILPALLGAAALGFLVWNWPPARIFMGDGGSGFVGLMLGVLAVRSAHVLPALVWAWLILLGVFVTDATLTLLGRLQRRERPHEAHQGHAYQHAARALKAHRPVTVTVALINLGWLFPIAAAVAAGWLHGATGVLVAYAPLVWLAMRWKS